MYKSKHELYPTWNAMMQRCYNSKRADFKYYGERGIQVCEEWHDFWNFTKDMGDRPEDNTLDRIDNEKNYGPSNCRWATHSIQCINRRNFKNTSGYRGVYFRKDNNKWTAKIKIHKNKMRHLGCFATKEEAIQARQQAEKEYDL